MAVKGAAAKADVTEKILKYFPGSFTHEKEIRIPYVEDGVAGEIKVVLTAAKNLVGAGTQPQEAEADEGKLEFSEVETPQLSEPSEAEKERLKSLLYKLNM